MKIAQHSLLIFLTLLLTDCKQGPKQDEWIPLFDGKNLTGWETYIGPKYDSAIGEFSGKRLGLNNDPDSVFSIEDLDGENVLRISGEHFGGISTLDSYSNYHLQLQFKWGDDKFAPRGKDSDKRDSGLLYHARGDHGVDWFFWMKSQEFQIQEGDCGDYWGLGSEVDIRTQVNADSTFMYDPNGELKDFGAQSKNSRNVKKLGHHENPNGEWNTLDLYCLGGTSYHIVNGHLVMILENSREWVNGKNNPVHEGKIQIQSEGAEVFYKEIKLRNINALPNL